MNSEHLILLFVASAWWLCDSHKVSNLCKIVNRNGTESKIKDCEKGEVCLPPTDVKLFFCSKNITHLCRIEVFGEVVRNSECSDESECLERFKRDPRMEKWRCQCENIEDEECRLKMKLRLGHERGMNKNYLHNCKKVFPNNTSINRPCPSTHTCRPPPEAKFYCTAGKKIGKVCRVEEYGEVIEETDCDEGQECLLKNETVWRCVKNNGEILGNKNRLNRKWGDRGGIRQRMMHKDVCKIEYSGGYERTVKDCPEPLVCTPPSTIKFSVCSGEDVDSYHPIVCKVEKDGRTVRERVCPQNAECIESEMKRRKSMWKCKCPEDMEDCEDKEWNKRKENRKMRKMLGFRKEGNRFRVGFRKRT